MDNACRRALAVMADVSGMEPDTMRGPSRDYAVTMARAIVMDWLCGHFDFTASEIGAMFSGRDRETVRNSILRMENARMAGDRDTRTWHKWFNLIIREYYG